MLLAFLALIIISNIVSGIYFFFMMQRSIEQETVQSEQQLTLQISSTIETYLKQVDRLTVRTAYDQSVLACLRKQRKGAKESLLEYTNDREIMFSFLNKASKIVDGIQNIVIYNNQGSPLYYYQAGSLNLDFSVRDEKWYPELTSTKDQGLVIFEGVHISSQFDHTDQPIVSIVRRIKDIQNFEGIGIIKVDISANAFADLIKNARENQNSFSSLIDQDGKVIISTDESIKIGTGYDKEFFDGMAQGTPEKSVRKYDKSKYLINYKKLDFSSWYLVLQSEKNIKTNNWRSASGLFLASCLISVAVAFILSLIMSRSIVKPLKILEHNMRKIEKGNFDIAIEITRYDEIGSLAQNFNRMSQRLKVLIEQIYKQEKEKRKAEIIALQAQINPHFIFNTLNTIKYMAVLQRANSVVTMMDSFIILMKAISHSTDDFISIEEEINRIRSYAYIEETRYFGKFNIEIKYDEEILQYKTIGFILQPIVENAIFHGIEPKVQRNLIEIGTIKVSIVKIEDQIQFIVEDNGVGMEQDSIQTYLDSDDGPKKSDNIGIRNVNKRIKLSFGEAYGIKIESELNEGSRVTINIPLISNESTELDS